jgi:hypothetical protein
MWESIGAIVMGRPSFDLVNGWEGQPPAGDAPAVRGTPLDHGDGELQWADDPPVILFALRCRDTRPPGARAGHHRRAVCSIGQARELSGSDLDRALAVYLGPDRAGVTP